jgi:iron complex outermembrane receptor protein
VTLGNYGVHNEELALSGPLADGLNFRVAGFDENQEQGYFKNVAGGPSEGGRIHTWYYEASATARLGDDTDLFVKAWSFGNKSRGGPGARADFNQTPYSTALDDNSSNLSFNPAAAYDVAGNGILPGSVVQTNNSITGNPAVGNRYNFSGNFPLQVNNKQDGDINFILTHHFPGMDLKYTGGYQQYTYQTIQSSETFGQQTDVDQYTVENAANPTCAPGGPQCLTIFPTVVTNYVQSDAWYSHEVTLSSTGNNPLQWIGGLYYYHETYSNPVTADLSGQSQVADPYYVGLNAAVPGLSNGGANPFGLLAAPANPGRSLYFSNYQFYSESKAVFGQLDWKITDTLKLTGGVRYTDDHKYGNEFYRLVVFGGQVLDQASGGALSPLATPALNGLLPTAIPVAFGGTGANLTTLPAIDLTQALCAGANGGSQKGVTSKCVINSAGYAVRGLGDTSNAVTGTAGVEWTPDSTTLAYIRYSRGYKELGFNAGSLANVPEVGPEHMDDFELGYKKTFGRNLVVDATLFYENYVDAQFPVELSNGGVNSSDFVSIPKARSDGLELETIWTPIDHLQFLLSYDFDDTAFQTGHCAGAGTQGSTSNSCYFDVLAPARGLQSIDGNPLPNSPKNKVSLNTNYTFIFDKGDLTLSGTYLWRDKQTGAIFNEAYWSAPSWSQVDLRATWRGKGDRYEVIVYGRNVFNTIGYPSGPTAHQYGNAALNGSGYSTGYQGTDYTINPPATYGIELHYKFF